MLLLTAGCTSFTQWVDNGFKVGPEYYKPAAPIALEWIDLAHEERIIDDSPDLAAWWTVLNDPVLNDLIATAYNQNLTVRQAGTRILQAQAIRNIRAGNLFPQEQRMTGEYSRFQIGDNAFDLWDTGFNLSWELDFWGRFRRAIEAADAELDASVEAYDDVLVLLLSDVAANYVQIRTLQRRLDFARANVEAQRGSLQIAQDRFQTGATLYLDVDQALTNLRQTEALIPQLENSLRVANNRLCVLLGIPPQDLTADWPPAPIPSVPPQVAVGMPAELLRRRPDVRRAERLVAAQSARIGIAEAELYPRFALDGSIHWQAEKFEDLFNGSESITAFAGPSFVWNILNYGRLRNGILLEQARFEELVYTYQEAVLFAQEEVENGIIGLVTAEDQNARLQEAVVASVDAERIVRAQYEEGAVDFNRVFVIQSSLASLQDQAAAAEGQIPLNLIAIYRALGGGWQIRLNPGDATLPAEPVPSPIAEPLSPPFVNPMQPGDLGEAFESDVDENL
jgi:NodT family efflux transporter outer membrane factor (OMF) lipoprotein